MRPDQKIVMQLPLEELWNDSGLLTSTRVGDLKLEQLRELLRTARVRFVVADVGYPLHWIPTNETYDFWTGECKPHLADPDAEVSLENYPGEYCYFASEWQTNAGEIIVLLSKSH